MTAKLRRYYLHVFHTMLSRYRSVRDAAMGSQYWVILILILGLILVLVCTRNLDMILTLN